MRRAMQRINYPGLREYVPAKDRPALYAKKFTIALMTSMGTSVVNDNDENNVIRNEISR